MSFYTSLYFYRPSPPPIVKGPKLAVFLRKLAATGVFRREHDDSFSVRFGRSIDQDGKGTVIYESAPGLPNVYRVRSIKWDLDHQRISFDDMLALLGNHDRPIYRASINLGTARPEIIAALQTKRPDDGNENLCLWDCSFGLGPVGIGSLSSEETFLVGWIDLSFSGNGYLFP